ncbi:MAG: hypothetical protein H6708_02775 [Kofleriaceae bacterium]|nr:hypothetical protein [Kofleriaceae bacterium]
MNEDELYERIASILETARTQVARTVNTAMVHAYWRIGREIVQVEQGGATRAGYGEQLMEQLARRLTAQYGRGFGVATIRRIRPFCLAFPGGSAIREIRSTVRIESGEKRAWCPPSRRSWRMRWPSRRRATADHVVPQLPPWRRLADRRFATSESSRLRRSVACGWRA